MVYAQKIHLQNISHTLISISASKMAAMIVNLAWSTPIGLSSHDWNGMLMCLSWMQASGPKLTVLKDSMRDSEIKSKTMFTYD